jgi:hypothetical protein
MHLTHAAFAQFPKDLVMRKFFSDHSMILIPASGARNTKGSQIIFENWGIPRLAPILSSYSSSLDPTNEAVIHRLSTIRNADLILVLDQGRSSSLIVLLRQ